jgi:hypothetical protein
MLARGHDGWGSTDGPIGPWGGVAEMGTLQKISGEWAKYPKLRYTMASHSNSAPPPTRPHGAVPPPPDACWQGAARVADSPMGVYGLGDGWPKWTVSCRKFLPHSYHGYHGFPYHTISYQFTTVKRYCTGRCQIIGVNHSDEVVPPQVPPIYTKMVRNILKPKYQHM